MSPNSAASFHSTKHDSICQLIVAGLFWFTLIVVNSVVSRHSRRLLSATKNKTLINPSDKLPAQHCCSVFADYVTMQVCKQVHHISLKGFNKWLKTNQLLQISREGQASLSISEAKTSKCLVFSVGHRQINYWTIKITTHQFSVN